MIKKIWHFVMRLSLDLIFKLYKRDNIIRYLQKKNKSGYFGDPAYGIMRVVYQIHGIDNYGDDFFTGEVYVFDEILKRIYNNKKDLVIFDVGANKGGYSNKVATMYPDSKIFAFEPNPYTFAKLKESASKNIIPICMGVGSVKMKSEIYVYQNDLVTEHASLVKDVIPQNNSVGGAVSVPVEIITIDEYAKENHINRIDFLKIDTEGYEFNVLIGAHNMIYENKIGVIQFEFNEMNVLARVFMKDFFDKLKAYNFYRVIKGGLIKLNTYGSELEVFKYQNILAIQKDIDNIEC